MRDQLRLTVQLGDGKVIVQSTGDDDSQLYMEDRNGSSITLQIDLDIMLRLRRALEAAINFIEDE